MRVIQVISVKFGLVQDLTNLIQMVVMGEENVLHMIHVIVMKIFILD